MQLDSVRELKQELTEPLRATAGLIAQDAPTVSVPARRATDLPRAQPTVALGVAVNGSEYRLAVRVQHRDVIGSERLAAIHSAARGEVDIRYIGRLSKLTDHALRTRQRPLLMGSSVGHYSITAGTAGGFVRLAEDDRPRLLSNNHVLADENRGKAGDEILQPGRLDGGRSGADRIATLERYVALETAAVNDVDCALAIIDAGVEFDANELWGLGPLNGTVPPEQADNVAKLGRTSGLTYGTVSAFEVDNVVVEFDSGLLRFDGQIEISGTPTGPFSEAGDSGSLIVTGDDRSAVGLLFAGSDQGGPEGYGVTYANPIAAVLDRLGAERLW